MINTMIIKNGSSCCHAREGDGIKLLFPTGTESRGRVCEGMSPTIMTAPVVGVVVRMTSSTKRIILKCSQAPRGSIQVEKGDGIAGGFLHNGQHPYCTGMSPTITCTNYPWVVIEEVRK